MTKDEDKQHTIHNTTQKPKKVSDTNPTKTG